MELANPWRYVAGLGGAVIIGLDSTEVESSLNLQGIKRKKRREIYAGLKIIADTAIPILNAR